MSSKMRPRQYADVRSIIAEGFDGNGVIAEGPTVPADATAGYAPGSLFFRRGGAAGAQLYINEGTALSSAFRPLGTQGATVVRRGVAAVTGTLTVVTGLSNVTAVIATMQDDPSINATIVTATVGNQAGSPAAGSVILKVFRPTSTTDTTPIASATATNVNWLAIGTP